MILIGKYQVYKSDGDYQVKFRFHVSDNILLKDRIQHPEE